MRRALVLAVILAACSKPTSPSAQQPDLSTAEGRARMLALMKPGGDSPVDRQIEKLQGLTERRAERTDAWIALGHAWVQKARDAQKPSLYLNAGACADQALLLEPGNRLALELRGLVSMNDHRFAEARALMESIVEKSPDLPVAWGTLSDALLELGKTEEAVRAAQRMMDLKPNLPSYSRAAHLQWLHGDLSGAGESLRAAIDAGGGSKDVEPKAWVLVQAAMMFWNEGDFEGAEAGFDRALALLPEFPPALSGKGRILIGRGDGKGAVSVLERAWKGNPLVETGWLLGDARQLAGDEAGAEQIRAEIEKRGKQSDPRTLSLFLSSKDLDKKGALELAEEDRKSRDDQYTEDAVAWALYRVGRLDDALAASERANRLGTRDARLWFHEGAIRIAGGDVARGRERIEKALALNPQFDLSGAKEAKALLDRRIARRR